MILEVSSISQLGMLIILGKQTYGYFSVVIVFGEENSNFNEKYYFNKNRCYMNLFLFFGFHSEFVKNF